MAWKDASVRALEPKRNPYRVFERSSDRGFCVRISPAGSKVFELVYTHPLKKTRRYLRLGAYPVVTLAEARERARQARRLIEDGLDPKEEREKERAAAIMAARTSGTVAQLFDYYLARLQAEGKGYKEPKRALEKDALPLLGAARAAREVSSADIKLVLYRLHERNAPTMANRLRSYLHRAFQLGIFHDNDPKNMKAESLFALTHNPVDAVPDDPTAEKAGERALTWQELRTFWYALDQHCSSAHAALLRLLLCSGLRVMEVSQAQRAEFDLAEGLWTIPGARIKTRHKRRADHIVPVTPLMAEQIERAATIAGERASYLFPAAGNPAAARPVALSTLSHVVKYVAEKAGLEHFTPRDLRRTWKTRGGELGIPMEWRNHVQNHAKSDVATVHYDVWEYLDEKREALERFCNHLSAVLAADDGKVVPIRRIKRA